MDTHARIPEHDKDSHVLKTIFLSNLTTIFNYLRFQFAGYLSIY